MLNIAQLSNVQFGEVHRRQRMAKTGTMAARSGGVEGRPARSSVGWGRRWTRMGSGLAPALVLVVFAPVLAEVLFGATPITNPGALLPDVAVYGCGALLIRELVRRRGLGWISILMLGVAFGIVEEGLALQPCLTRACLMRGTWVVGRWESTGCGRSG